MPRMRLEPPWILDVYGGRYVWWTSLRRYSLKGRRKTEDTRGLPPGHSRESSSSVMHLDIERLSVQVRSTSAIWYTIHDIEVPRSKWTSTRVEEGALVCGGLGRRGAIDVRECLVREAVQLVERARKRRQDRKSPEAGRWHQRQACAGRRFRAEDRERGECYSSVVA